MFKRKAYSKKQMEIISLTYFLIGSFLILGSLIVLFIEGGSWILSLSAFPGIIFVLTGNRPEHGDGSRVPKMQNSTD